MLYNNEFHLILTYIFRTLSSVSFNFFLLSFKTFSFNGDGCSTLYSEIQYYAYNLIKHVKSLKSQIFTYPSDQFFQVLKSTAEDLFP